MELIRHFHERYAPVAKQNYMSNRLDEVHISQFESEDCHEAKAFHKTIK